MAYTKFGEFMRILRIKHHEVMGDTASLLGVSVPFLSAVENGKKNVPSEWFPKIASHYMLSDEEKDEMEQAAYISRTQMKLNLVGSEPYQREMALQFARAFEGIDEETAKRILEVLRKSGDNNRLLH